MTERRILNLVLKPHSQSVRGPTLLRVTEQVCSFDIPHIRLAQPKICSISIKQVSRSRLLGLKSIEDS